MPDCLCLNPGSDTSGCVTLYKLTYPVVPQLPHVQNEDNKSNYLVKMKSVNLYKALSTVSGTQ